MAFCVLTGCIFYDMVWNIVMTLLRGIPWDIPASLEFLSIHTPLKVCVYIENIQLTHEIFHSIPLESVTIALYQEGLLQSSFTCSFLWSNRTGLSFSWILITRQMTQQEYVQKQLSFPPSRSLPSSVWQTHLSLLTTSTTCTFKKNNYIQLLSNKHIYMEGN